MDTQATPEPTKLRASRANLPGSASTFGAALPFLALLAIGVAFPLFGGGYWGVIATRACVYWVLVAGLNLVVGFAGGEMLLAFFGNGPMLTFYGFVPVALGGMGNNRGAVVAGLLLGLFQQTANFLVGGIFASVAVFTAFILVLLAFPDGIAGASAQRRV